MTQTANFLGYESAPLDKALFSVIPAPFEETATFCKGQAAAPQAIFDASRHIPAYDEETGLSLAESAIHSIAPSEAPKGDRIGEFVMQRFQQAIDATAVPFILGGEGSVTLWGVQALLGKAEEISILHLDAHADMDDAAGGENHHTVMRRVSELKARKPVHICQVGVRSLSKSAFDRIVDDTKPVNCLFMSDIHRSTDDSWHEDVIEELRSPVYVSIDLSLFDPAVIPAVGHPEPGGFDWWPALRLLKKVAARRRIAGVDLCELCPRAGDMRSDYATARLAYKLMNYIAAGGKMLAKQS